MPTALQREGKAHYMYEGTVGAGLPIISTLKTLQDTGDDVLRIEGVFRWAAAAWEGLGWVGLQIEGAFRWAAAAWGAWEGWSWVGLRIEGVFSG